MTIPRPPAERDLAGHVAIVTGANHGIGAATAKHLAGRGAAVVLGYLRLPVPGDSATVPDGGVRERYDRMKSSATGEGVADEIRDAGGRAIAREADLSSPDTIAALFDEAETRLGPVDILVNNADHCISDTFVPGAVVEGLSPGGDVKRSFSAALFDAHAAVNCRAPGLAMAEFAERHVRRSSAWGRIVSVSTDASPGFAGEVSYGATKYALESLSCAAAGELGPFGITVNVVSPGPIQTGYLSEESEARIAAATPLRRVGRPDDVADVIGFLCSDQARWLTGQILFVGGGWRMR